MFKVGDKVVIVKAWGNQSKFKIGDLVTIRTQNGSIINTFEDGIYTLEQLVLEDVFHSPLFAAMKETDED